MIKISENIPYAHTSICLSDEFSQFYSFGRKDKYNFLKCGFVIENVEERYLTWYPNSRLRILEVPVTNEQYRKLETLIHYFVSHTDQYKYNLRGVLLLKTGHRRKTEPHNFFCSQFVNYILKEAGIEILQEAPEYTTPKSFYLLDYPIAYEGSIQNLKDLQRIRRQKTVDFCF